MKRVLVLTDGETTNYNITEVKTLQVENGELVITAKRENFGNRQYTSARMITQGNASWKYGRMESRIKLPSFMGSWPAFWMLGENISSVGWPNCGEIDIMEHVNADPDVHGTIHYTDNNSNYDYIGNSIDIDVTQYHVYAIEWDESSIKWFVDGVQYHEVNILDNINGRSEFHNDFFLILNLAIGGRWPGFNIDNTAFPAKMNVDYVRVYRASNGLPQGTPGLTGIYYLKNRNSEKYMSIDAASIIDGANLEQANFTGEDYQKFLFREVSYGTYAIVNYKSEKILDVSNRDTINGTNVQQWENFNSSNQHFVISKTNDGFFKIVDSNSGKILDVENSTLDIKGNIQIEKDNGQTSAQWSLESTGYFFIEAEDYSSNNKVIKENTTDEYGGENVGALDQGNWISFNDVLDIPKSGKYLIEYRVASFSGRGQLTADLNNGAITLGSLELPNTGGWQNWTTISHEVDIVAGTFDFGIYSNESGWNLNWIQITPIDNLTAAKDDFNGNDRIVLSPNPVVNSFSLMSESELSLDNVAVYNSLGAKMTIQQLRQNTFDVSGFYSGVYVVLIKDGDKTYTTKFVKH